MPGKTAIEWATDTWNPVTGCTRVSAGCDNCYAARQAAGRLKNTSAYEGLAVITPSGRAAFNGRIRLLPERLDQPLRWRRPRRVFVNSMSDLFHPGVPDEFIDRVFAVMALAPHHVFQVLTKRPERMAAYMTKGVANRVAAAVLQTQGWNPAAYDAARAMPLRNVWLGTSVEDQAAADERIPHLLRTPAAVRFLSCEPLLGPVDLDRWIRLCRRDLLTDESGRYNESRHRAANSMRIFARPEAWALHWVIVGGESGPGARPMDVAWAGSLVEQCRSAGVPVFVKQLGAKPVSEHHPDTVGFRGSFHTNGGPWQWLLRDRKGGDWSEWPEDLRVREMPEVAA